MKFTVEGREYDFDADHLSVGEARLVKQHTDMGVRTWLLGINDYDVDAWMALVLVAKKRNNEAVTWADLQDLDFLEICNSHNAAKVAELQERMREALDSGNDGEEAPDPTEPAERTPARKKKASGKAGRTPKGA